MQFLNMQVKRSAEQGSWCLMEVTILLQTPKRGKSKHF